MRIADVDIVIQPGLTGSGEDHWQSRWEAKLSTATRVSVDDWDKPNLAGWVDALVATVERTTRPVVVVAHSLGVAVAVHAAERIANRTIGAYLVAPADVDRTDLPPGIETDFAPMPLKRLPFPSVVVASTDDPYCTLDRARLFADAWGAQLSEAGESGHINAESGHGPWPEGLMRFAGFLSTLQPPPTKT